MRKKNPKSKNVRQMNKLGSYIGVYVPKEGLRVSLEDNHRLPRQGQKVLVVRQLNNQLTSSIDGKSIGCEEIVVGSAMVTNVSGDRASIHVPMQVHAKKDVITRGKSEEQGRLIIKEIFD